MAGTLGRLDLLPSENFETIRTKLSVFGEAMESLAKQGLTSVGPPVSGYRGEMPKELSSLDDERLGDLLNEASSLCAWLDEMYGQALAQHREADEILNSARADVRIKLKVDEDGKKMTVSDKNDRVENDPNVVEARRRELFYFVRVTVLRNARETAQKKWDTVSRHITIRGQEVERLRRGEAVAGAPLRASRPGGAFRR